MTDRTRDNDNGLSDELTDHPSPSQGNAGGGDLASEIGQPEELQSGEGEDPSIARVREGDKPRQGDVPALPNCQKTSDE